MVKPRFRQYPQNGTITIADGTTHIIETGGNFVRVKQADQDFNLVLDDDIELNASVNDVFRFTEGDTFKRVVVQNNSGADLTFQLEIGFGAVDTNTLSIQGSVKTAGGSTRNYGSDTLSTTAKEIISSNINRTGWEIYNNSSVTIYIGSDSSVTASNGRPIPAGGSFGWNDTDAVFAIAESGSGNDIRYQEVE